MLQETAKICVNVTPTALESTKVEGDSANSAKLISMRTQKVRDAVRTLM